MSDSDTNPTRDAERQRMQDELRRPLLPALIARRDSRDYLPIPQAITQANRIFGPGNWRTEIKSHTAITDDKGMVTGYKCIVRVTVETLGTCFEGVGFEQMTRRRGDTSSLQTPQAHDTAMKGAESDAVKRALRYFGDAFGNALYEKDDERERVFRFVVDAIDRGEIGTKEAERMILGPFRRPKEVPISMALGVYYKARDEARRNADSAEAEPADSDPEDVTDRFPDLPEPPDDPNDDDEREDDESTDHDDLPARRRRNDPFRGDGGDEA